MGRTGTLWAYDYEGDAQEIDGPLFVGRDKSVAALETAMDKIVVCKTCGRKFES